MMENIVIKNMESYQVRTDTVFGTGLNNLNTLKPCSARKCGETVKKIPKVITSK